ncbi:MAG: sulfurtransferase [Rhodobacteraceae bacterium]|nr:sulfurtransferase [Paracoccaceae bacterium]
MNMPFSRPAAVQGIAPADAVAKANNNEAIVIDVRDINELMSSGTAKGALHIPLMMMQTKADPRHPEFHPELNVDKPVILFCASGARSGMAAQALLANGFKEVYNLGGLMHWHQGGGQVVAAG